MIAFVLMRYTIDLIGRHVLINVQVNVDFVYDYYYVSGVTTVLNEHLKKVKIVVEMSIIYLYRQWLFISHRKCMHVLQCKNNTIS